jgi:hypothetical protein
MEIFKVTFSSVNYGEVADRQREVVLKLGHWASSQQQAHHFFRFCVLVHRRILLHMK